MNDYEILKAMRDEIQAEHALLANRMTWYVTSQAFLMTAYATASSANHLNHWSKFFQNGIPTIGISLSVFAGLGIIAAVRAQADVIASQTRLIIEMRERLKNEDPSSREKLERLEYLASITCTGRPSRSLTHWIAMIPPCLIPPGFLLTWIVAWIINRT